MDVRVIVATHRNLDELVRKGAFRQDLYHRVYVFPLRLPPLRERLEDIPVLVEHFAAPGLRAERLEAQAVHRGGDRGAAPLRLAGQRARAAQRGGAAAAAGRRPGGSTWLRAARPAAEPAAEPAPAAPASPGEGPLAERTEHFEREVILAELKRHQRMTDTARALGLERSHLYKKCQQLRHRPAGHAERRLAR